MSQGTLLVTGASGQLGRRVVELLLEKGVHGIVATTRSPDKLADFKARGVDVRQADFDDDASLARAFAGAARALLISADDVVTPGRRAAQHKRAVKALESAGVEHVVYTSLPAPTTSSASVAPDHAATEAALTESRLGVAVLRNNLYADLFLFTLPGAVKSGKLIDARGNGAAAFVTREDCARAAAAALLDRNAPARSTLDVTGPEALTSAQVAAILSEIVGKKIEHVAVTPEQLSESLVGHGLPPPVANVYKTFDIAISKGELAAVSDTVQRLTGHAPQHLADYLRSQKAALVG